MTTTQVPKARGPLEPNRSLADLTWLRVGGPADWLFLPADADDLSEFLAVLDPGTPVFAMGVGSNLIVRDGGIRGVVVRLGSGFRDVEIDGDRVVAGAGALDSAVARRAAAAGLDLAFLRTIPGTVGGAVAMNAGCYGTYVSDVLESVELVCRDGSRIARDAASLGLGYRRSDLPEGAVVVSATFKPGKGDPGRLAERMEEQKRRRDASQPAGDRTAGSTFRNPSGGSSTGEDGDPMEGKAWSLIDAAGMRGARLGGAVMNSMHPNFLTNAGGATAADLESLGELVRKKVCETTGCRLEWEIMRVGDPAPGP